jgi:predicted acetyltransferase
LTDVTDVVIRPVTPDDDYDAQLDLSQRAFGIYSAQQAASWLHMARLRAAQGLFLGAFVDGMPAGAAMLHDMRQYWLGQPVRMAGVASVKVAPEHRGRGIGRTLMTELLALIADRGYPLSALYPATVPIYRSLGWELAGAKHKFRVPARSLRGLAEPDQAARGAGAGHLDVPVRRAGPADAATVLGVIGESHRAARDAGPLTWDEDPAAQWLGRPDLYSYLAGDDGFAAYRWLGDDLWVERVHARAPETLRALWSVIASHSSTTGDVRGWTSPRDPFWWLTRERDATVTYRSMWMLRVVDAGAAIAARGFPPGVSASVPLEIHDQARPANSGHWRLTVADGAGTLTPNEGVPSPAPLTLGPRGLGALYAGTPVATLRLAGLAAGGGQQADAALDAAFAATPYMVDDF